MKSASRVAVWCCLIAVWLSSSATAQAGPAQRPIAERSSITPEPITPLPLQVDLDSRLIERWRPGDDRPEILSETLTWQLVETAASFELDVAAFFAEVLDG